jgi:hypothetical protein
VPEDNLGAKMDAVELVEMWCKAIRARCESSCSPAAGRGLQARGRQERRARLGRRAEAEKQLKAFRLKKEQMYD